MFNLRDKETLYATKEEGEASSSSRQWSSAMKNPRIVRVSRTFGGKDRHSKVTTIKGLRDRRIRLSVSTAIQLYDLQDRLGLSQPSKVIDWLLDSTKHDIDKLPPLPAIPGNFPPFQQSIYTSQGYEMPLSSYPFIDSNFFPPSRREGINIDNLSVGVNEDSSIVAKLKYWDSKQKKIDDDQGAIGEDNGTRNSQILAQNLFPIASGNNASIVPNPTSLLSNHPMYNYYHYWEPSNISLTQTLGLSSHNGHHHHHQGNSSNSSSIPSSLALSSSFQLHPSPSMETSSLFPQHASFNHLQVDNDIRQFNRFNSSNNPFPSSLYTPTGLGLKPFPLSISQDQSHLNQDKNNDDNPWKE